MKANVGKADRVFRLAAGIILVVAGIWLQKWFWAVGIIFIVTGLFRWCPLYKVFGINTCERGAHRNIS